MKQCREAELARLSDTDSPLAPVRQPYRVAFNPGFRGEARNSVMVQDDNAVVPATIRAVPTERLAGAVEQYTRAVCGTADAHGGSLDIARERVELAQEWKRVQAAVVYEMSWMGASQDRQQLACRAVASRVLDAADGSLLGEGLRVPRDLVCEVLKQATPETPVDVT